jgi:two-component system, NarL family, nitrate/nitrite response regulator NarL
MNAKSPITVALVDDHRTVLSGLKLLIDAQWPAMSVVGVATTIDEACRMCATCQPDVLILDLDLGGHNGADAIPQLIANGRTAVLVLTGARNPELHHAAVIAGARGVVAKEAEAAVIVKAIQKVHAGEIWLDRRSTQIILTTLASQPRVDPATPLEDLLAKLTPRERDVILALSTNAGAPAKEVAALLGISEHTLRNHLSSIYDKLGVSTRLALYEFAQKHRLAR